VPAASADAIADAIAQALAGAGPPTAGGRPRPPATRVTVCGTPDAYISQGNPDTILAGFGLDGSGLAATACTLLA